MMKNLEDLLQDRVPLGILSNTHGLNGDLKLYPFSNSSDFLSTLTEAVAYKRRTEKIHQL